MTFYKRLYGAKKLVSILAICLSMIKTSKKDDVALQMVPYVHHPIWFKKKKVQALIDTGSEVNTMTPAYVS